MAERAERAKTEAMAATGMAATGTGLAEPVAEGDQAAVVEAAVQAPPKPRRLQRVIRYQP